VKAEILLYLWRAISGSIGFRPRPGGFSLIFVPFNLETKNSAVPRLLPPLLIG